METIRGVVSKVRFSTEVSGREHVTTSHVAVFEINKTQVELKLNESIIVDNGDEILLAGKINKGLFKALAYNNLTNNVSGKGQVSLYMFLGIAFTLVGLMLFPSVMSLILFPVGIYMIWYSKQLSKAYTLVTSDL